MIAPVDAERRLVTVLYADLVGHTELVTRLDPEDWRALLQRYFAAMVQPIQRYGGTVEKFIGDAIFAVFGVPRAHEDDAARAVRAAVEMREALERLNPAFAHELGVPLGLRIGIATGEAVAPGEAGEDRLVVGDLTTLAERLQRAAPPNGIVLSERTHTLVAALVEGEPLGPLELKGFPETQRAVLLRRLLPEKQAPGAGLTAPLVNRVRELADLLAAGERLRAGQGHIVFLIGEAGLGKSRLAAELRDRLDPGVRFVVGRCYEFTQGVSHGAVLQLLRAHLEVGELDPPEAGRVKLDAALQHLFGTATPEVRPALHHLLGLDTAAFAARTRGLGPEDVRAELLRAVTTFWERAAQGPIVLLVEDLHWVDAASAEVLRRLFEVTERVPLLLLCAFRPERRSLAWELRVAAERDYPHRYEEIRLGPLSPDETEQLAAVLLEQLTLPVDLKTSVARRAEGNPFYVEEVVRSLRHPGVPAGAPRVPDTLQGVLQARLDALPPPTRRVLQAASVIGRMFPLRLLQVLVDIDGELPGHISELQRRDFLRELQRIPEPSFAFKHVLLQEAAYQTLLRKERRRLHLRLGEALEGEATGRDAPALLGHHFRQAGAWGKAFQYGLKAGDAARSLSAFQEALGHYDTALAIARDHHESVTDAAALLHAQMARGDCLWLLGRFAELERHHAELLRQHRAQRVRAQIYRSIGRTYSMTGDLRKAQRNLEKALHLLEREGSPEVEAGVYRELARIMERRRRYADALAHAERALAIAERHELQGLLGDIYAVLTATHFFGGDVEQALHCAEEALRLAVAESNHVAIIRARNNLADFPLFKGRLREAMDQARQAVELAKQLGLVVPLALPQITVAEILLEQGRWEDARAVLDAVQDHVRRHDLGTAWQAQVQREQAFLFLGQGRWSDALQYLEEVKGLEERAGITRHLPKMHRGLAEAYLGQRDFSRARIHALRVRTLERGGNPIETPGALRILAVIAREAGSLRRAVRLLEESRTLMAKRTGCGEHARVLLELARTQATAGRKAEAREAVEESIVIAQALECAPLLNAAERFAAEL